MRNSLYSVTVQEALAEASGTYAYQKQVLGLISLIWVTWASLFTALQLHSPSQCVAFLSGLALGGFLGGTLSSRWGRKVITLFSQAIAGLFLLLALLIGVFDIPLLAIVGLCAGAAMTCGYLLLLEVVDVERRGKYNSYLFCSYGAGLFVSRMMFIWDTQFIYLFVVLGICAIITGASVVKIYESPSYLAAARGRYSIARSIIDAIGKKNGTEGFTQVLEGEKVIGNQELGSEKDPPLSEQSPNRRHTFIPISDHVRTVTASELRTVPEYGPCNILTLKSIRPKIVLVLVLGFPITFTFGVILQITSANSLLGVLSGVSLFLAMCILQKILICLTRHSALILFQSLLSCTCLFWVIFEIMSCNGDSCKVFGLLREGLLVIGEVLSLSSMAALYLLTMETVQTTVRSPAMGWVQLVLQAGLLLGTGLVLYYPEAKVKAMLASIGLTVIGCLAVCLVNESEYGELEDYTEEDKIGMNKPQDISSMNISVNNPEQIRLDLPNSQERISPFNV